MGRVCVKHIQVRGCTAYFGPWTWLDGGANDFENIRRANRQSLLQRTKAQSDVQDFPRYYWKMQNQQIDLRVAKIMATQKDNIL